MSFVCTYMQKYSGVRTAGMCHQVHGSFGVIAEMLGFEPGDLQVVSAGINHLNWLIDIRRKGTGESFMKEFSEKIRSSEYWNKVFHNIPENYFSREVFEIFGAYPVGYDSHIAEYMQFFHTEEEMKGLGYPDHVAGLEDFIKHADEVYEVDSHLQVVEMNLKQYPFPKDQLHPHYKESACPVMESLAGNIPNYFDSMVTVNHGAVDNLPDDAVVDVPAVVVGGDVRSVHAGRLPDGCAEICRRQIAIHEMLVKAVMVGDRNAALQCMCLDPYVKSLTQAKNILGDFLAEYREELPQFWR
jgi:alpha-galactosidase